MWWDGPVGPGPKGYGVWCCMVLEPRGTEMDTIRETDLTRTGVETTHVKGCSSLGSNSEVSVSRSRRRVRLGVRGIEILPLSLSKKGPPHPFRDESWIRRRLRAPTTTKGAPESERKRRKRRRRSLRRVYGGPSTWCERRPESSKHPEEIPYLTLDGHGPLITSVRQTLKEPPFRTQ